MTQLPVTRFATSTDGTSIAWYDFGGNGPDLFLGHATGFCAHVWAPVLDTLRESFRCYAYDLRGHGSSARPAGGREAWDWQRYADDAAAALTAARLDKPISVGHSSGSATALLLEERAPGTFAAHVGFEPVMFADDPPTGPDEERDLAVRTRERRKSFPSRHAALENFSTRGPFTNLDRRALGAYIDHGFKVFPDGSVQLRCNPEDEAAVYVMATDHDGFVRLDEIRCPVTVVRGAESNAFDEPTMREVAKRVCSGRFVEVEGVGHFGALEKPDEFARIVTAAVSPPL